MKTLSGKLRELPKCSPHRSASARIREIIDDVEYARSQGVSYKELVRELEKAGFAISVSALRGALRRYRRKQNSASDKSGSASDARPIASVTPEQDDSEEITLWEKTVLERFNSREGVISVMTSEIVTVSQDRAK